MSLILFFLERFYLATANGMLERLIPRAQRWKDIQTGWTQSSSKSAEIVPWIVGIAVAVLVTFTIINTRKESVKRKQRELIYFERKAIEKELDKKQVEMLSEAVKLTNLTAPYRILDSFDIFQHLLEEYHKKRDFSDAEHRYFHQMVDDIKSKLGFNKIEEAVQLQSSEEIRKGTLLKITLQKDGKSFEYPASVIDNSDERIVLDSSQIDLNFIPLDMNTALEINFYREADAGYNFVTQLKRPPAADKNELEVRHPKQLKRVQARSFSRMEVRFRFSYYHVPKDKFNTIEIDQNLEYCQTLPVYMADTQDISGGGIAFNSKRTVQKGDYVFLNFQMISEEHSEPVLAVVVWRGADKAKPTNLIRAKFYHITDTTQDTLMKFIYQIQRKAARKMKFAPKR
ncbi:MAG: hypothetical protein A3F83_02280 [Candidatus Glassbacteria bacterium RIFCSPLOWO2_12_FULL_58_11]|uniref:PilZ domain-containing protein n=1 Tax=Candidatus Glassbacteria bacterium RIFCSPLOWO2_12_FULL_58_11 TaxID=1817867 RepID=A0A1F5YLD7_9BACT|nr:MAG: hypothetical protein A3F83_02280 [Candidatus Glassbacteria bacterium RIFCSPLOWO2_12_FULL_58_11]